MTRIEWREGELPVLLVADVDGGQLRLTVDLTCGRDGEPDMLPIFEVVMESGELWTTAFESHWDRVADVYPQDRWPLAVMEDVRWDEGDMDLAVYRALKRLDDVWREAPLASMSVEQAEAAVCEACGHRDDVLREQSARLIDAWMMNLPPRSEAIEREYLRGIEMSVLDGCSLVEMAAQWRKGVQAVDAARSRVRGAVVAAWVGGACVKDIAQLTGVDERQVKVWCVPRRDW